MVEFLKLGKVVQKTSLLWPFRLVKLVKLYHMPPDHKKLYQVDSPGI